MSERSGRLPVLMALIALAALLLLAALAAVAAPAGAPWQRLEGSGHVTREERRPGAFSAITLDGIGELVVVQGPDVGVAVETDDNLQALVRSEVRDGTLHLSLGSRRLDSAVTRLVYTVTVRDLERLTIAGAATVSAVDLVGERLAVHAAGTGAITLGGSVREQHVVISGAGRYDTAGLDSARAVVTIQGLGDTVVQVRDRLEATIEGAGSITYIGTPEVQRSISGLGQIRQR